MDKKFMLSMIMVLLFCATIIFCVFYYTEKTRYYLDSHSGIAYKIDKKTGNIWLVTPDSIERVK